MVLRQSSSLIAELLVLNADPGSSNPQVCFQVVSLAQGEWDVIPTQNCHKLRCLLLVQGLSTGLRQKAHAEKFVFIVDIFHIIRWTGLPESYDASEDRHVSPISQAIEHSENHRMLEDPLPTEQM